MRVVTWVGRGAGRAAPRPRPRPSGRPLRVARRELGEFTPDPAVYLGQAAYLQLSFFEALGHAASLAPDVRTKALTARVASSALARHAGLVRELERDGLDPAEAMAEQTGAVDAFRSRTHGDDWHEAVLATYVGAGLLNDVFSRLAAGLPSDHRTRVAAVLDPGDDDALIVAELSAAFEADPRLASRLALWGRRLVGDTLLVARAAIEASHQSADDERLEPVFTELIADHTRRMDALGLTA